MSIHITGGTVLTAVLTRADLVTDGSSIAALDASPPAGALRLDATGVLVLPGMVDCHGDAFERHIMPRPRVSFGLSLRCYPSTSSSIRI